MLSILFSEASNPQPLLHYHIGSLAHKRAVDALLIGAPQHIPQFLVSEPQALGKPPALEETAQEIKHLLAHLTPKATFLRLHVGKATLGKLRQILLRRKLSIPAVARHKGVYLGACRSRRMFIHLPQELPEALIADKLAQPLVTHNLMEDRRLHILNTVAVGQHNHNLTGRCIIPALGRPLLPPHISRRVRNIRQVLHKPHRSIQPPGNLSALLLKLRSFSAALILLLCSSVSCGGIAYISGFFTLFKNFFARFIVYLSSL